MVDFFRAIGITSADVGLKVNSRRVLSAILTKFGIAPDQVATTSPSPSPLTLGLTLTRTRTRTRTRTFTPNPKPATTPNQVTRISDNLSVQRDARDLELYNKVRGRG